VKRLHSFLLTATVVLVLAVVVAVLVVFAGRFGGNWSSGDRVLVAKFLYDSGLEKPERYHVVVFKYPTKPLKMQVPTNYIKRLMGLPGELLAIFFGRIYRCDDEPSKGLRRELDDAAQVADTLDLWMDDHLHRNDERAVKLFQEGKYKILVKPPETMLAMRRLVYDHDHPAKDLEGVLPPRWVPENAGWTADQTNGFSHAGQPGSDVSWLRYQHILRPETWPTVSEADRRPQLIRDFSGYNSFEIRGGHAQPPPNWVGDLMLDFELTVDRPEGELWLQLARGVDRVQARWNLQSGDCTLFRLSGANKVQELQTAKTRINKAGSYQLRFANFDDRLTVWVDRELVFGDGVPFEPAQKFGPTANDLRPALIGSKGAAVRVHRLKLYRDTYYTSNVDRPDASLRGDQIRDAAFWSDPLKWDPLRDMKPATLFVQPGHYLCLGDNSPESSDSRSWGTVPERLMLGRALQVYFPFNRAGPIR
jgi:signal peptidase I